MKKYQIAIIANSTSLPNREVLKELLGEPQNGFFKPLEFEWQGLDGAIIPLDYLPSDVLSPNKTAIAQKSLIKAIEYLEKRSIKLICLAASTKRLGGKKGELLKKIFPNLVFTIGDNVTYLSFEKLIKQCLVGHDENERIFCLGGGYLANGAINFLVASGYQVLVLSRYVKSQKNVEVLSDFVKIGKEKFSLMLSCTHIHALSELNFLKPKAKIIDVSVPAGISPELYFRYKKELGINLFHAGNFFVEGINYDFPSSVLSLPSKDHFFGCFTEALLLSKYVLAKDTSALEGFDFFNINKQALAFISQLIEKEKLGSIYVPKLNFYEFK